jgi:hypothetical protein
MSRDSCERCRELRHPFAHKNSCRSQQKFIGPTNPRQNPRQDPWGKMAGWPVEADKAEHDHYNADDFDEFG